MNKTLLSINIAFALSLILGAVVGWKLSFFQSFQHFKLLNLMGIFYDLVGVVLLSYIILAQSRTQHIVADHISRYLVIFSASFPLAIGMAAGASLIWSAPSAKEVIIFASLFAVVMTVPISRLFGSPVFEPVGAKKYEPEYRIKVLGTLFLALGFTFQIIASAADILSGA